MDEHTPTPWTGGLEIAPGLRLVQVGEDWRLAVNVPALEPPSIPVSAFQAGYLTALFGPGCKITIDALRREADAVTAAMTDLRACRR